MASHIKNLLKQLPRYGKTIKPRIKKFTNTKLLPELRFFEKLVYAGIGVLFLLEILV